MLEFEYHWKHTLTTVANVKMSLTQHEPEGKAQPAAGGVPQLTVGGAPQHTGVSKTDQTEWFSPPMSENSAANFMRLAPGSKPAAEYLHC